MNDLIEMNLFYIKYNLLPNLMAFGLAYSYYNKININCSLNEYYNHMFSFFNIYHIDLKEEYRMINNILINKYSLLIINTDSLELIKIKKIE